MSLSVKNYLLSLLVLSSFVFSAFAADEVNWRPVTPQELAMKEPRVEPDADAEAIFWEVKLDDRKLGKLSFYHYVRVKIFTERGREKFAKFDIPFTKTMKIEDVAARVIKPDGTIVNLNPSDIFEREIVKKGKIKVQAKSFAVPGIEPGVIVEYQYRETRKNDSVAGERLIFQRDIPMQKVSYYVRPYGSLTPGYNYFNMTDTRFREDPTQKGYQFATLTDVPSYKEEPYMPPDDEVRKWVFVSYQTLNSLLVWNNLATDYSTYMKSNISKPSKAVKQKAAELIAGATTDEDKLRRLYDFSQKQIKNVSFDPSITEEQLEKTKIEDADDVLKKRIGDSFWIEVVFGSLAAAAGFEVNFVLSGDRSENFFSREKYPFRNFVHRSCMAVKVGGKWQYFNPGAPYIPYGRLIWFEEDTEAMLVGDTGGVWTRIPLSEPAKSPVKRTGKFDLSEDGTLEGTVRLEFDGHQAMSRRRDEFTASNEKRQESIKEEYKAQMSTAEISDITIENFEDNAKPLVYNFKVKVPNYALKTGKRLIVQPGFFEYGTKTTFPAANRTHHIYFPYPWSEQDDLKITFPKNYMIDTADTPAELADTGKISTLKVAMGIDDTTGVLHYRRDFYFGGNGKILFANAAYPAIKNLFDGFHKANTHSITIKQK